MLKKIRTEALRPGMYVHDLNCGWIDHPFLRSRFAVTSEAQVRKVVAAGVRELYIDTSRGDNVDHAPTVDEAKAALDREMRAAALVAMTRRPTAAADETSRARRVMGEATTIVRNVMADVRLGNQVRIEAVGQVVEKMTGSILRNRGALLSLARMKNKDDYTFMHSVSVGALLIAFCHDQGADAATIRDAGIGGMLHDIGKVRIAHAVLHKPGRLTEKELATMKTHVAHSQRILAATPGIPALAMDVAAQHHERHDGSGYPGGLAGDAIAPIGQMAAICDVYDAITSDRVYHRGLEPTEALRKIFEWSKFHFNPQLTQSFLRCIGIYPVGSLVQLESGRLALVVDQQHGNLLQPRVRVIYHTRAGHYLPPEDVDLAAPHCNDRIVSHESPERWSIDPSRFL